MRSALLPVLCERTTDSFHFWRGIIRRTVWSYLSFSPDFLQQFRVAKTAAATAMALAVVLCPSVHSPLLPLYIFCPFLRWLLVLFLSFSPRPLAALPALCWPALWSRNSGGSWDKGIHYIHTIGEQRRFAKRWRRPRRRYRLFTTVAQQKLLLLPPPRCWPLCESHNGYSFINSSADGALLYCLARLA